MKNINLMFLTLLISGNVFAENSSVSQSVDTVETINKAPNEVIDQTQAQRQEDAKEPVTSATDKNIQKEIKVKPQDTSDSIPKDETDLIDGLILNRAMTRLGHRFYRQFVGAYRDIGGITKHSGITIIEQATARSGSKMLIQQNRKTIFVTFVSPISRNLDDQANYAAKRVNTLIKQENERALLGAFLDPDLAPDEI
ncbi:curli production assembly/transport protein CsgE [Shewanella sp. 10N.286.51.B7]|uniref:curli production assembly/transport protein CsgE n=1 Tax=Shewanella sp. 10N.286.51.B7 TaxID=1880836 RepID=UPI001F53C79D|nr:curli production assembly/transport protein CsgE [Shewanella sp. 10N.286.51.B7]